MIMGLSETIALAILGGFGVVVGMCAGIIGARRNGRMPTALLASGTIAAGLLLLVSFAFMAIGQLQDGEGVFWALYYATGWTIMFALTVPVITAIPALVSAAISFYLTDRFCSSKRNI